jgi:simple sugar transport system permease protein
MKNDSKLLYTWRAYLERSFSILIPMLAILAAFAVSGLLILTWGANPLVAYKALFSGAFGSPNAIATTLERMTPLIMTGLAVAYGYRSGFFNIGAEGQLYMGAIAAVWVAIMFPNWPGWLLLPACLIASGIMGMIWISLPAYLKAKRGINEVLTTLLMNYIALQYFEWIVRVDHVKEGITLFGGVTPVWTFLNWIGLKDPTQPHPKSPFLVDASFMPSLKSIFETGWIKGLLGHTAWYQELMATPAFGRMTLAPVIAVLAAGFMFFLMFKTVTGYRSRAVGVNPEAAKFMGINVSRTLFITALISGTLGGLAGGLEVLGTQHRVIPGFLVNAGFDGIPVALIGQLHPFGAVLSAIFFGAMRAGSNKMQVITSVPVAVVYIIQALAIMFAVAGTTINIQAIIKKRRLRKETDTKKAAQLAEGEAPNA